MIRWTMKDGEPTAGVEPKRIAMLITVNYWSGHQIQVEILYWNTSRSDRHNHLKNAGSMGYATSGKLLDDFLIEYHIVGVL
jgi:hypothetical protein